MSRFSVSCNGSENRGSHNKWTKIRQKIEQNNYFNNINNYNNIKLLPSINLKCNYSCIFIKLNRVLLLIYFSNKCYLIMCIICNPPFNQCVSTNILKVFLKLLDKHFPKSSILHKIFNRNSIKVNYSCTQNHDMRILNSRTQNCLPYNCQKKEEHGVLQVSPPPPPLMSNPTPLGLSPLPTSIDSPPLPLFIPHNSHFQGF